MCDKSDDSDCCAGKAGVYEMLVQQLKEKGIKLVAVDFDGTLLSIHTRGSWIFTAPPLATKLRPGFAQFMSEVLKQGLFIAIVTFSPQIALIQEVLNIVFTKEEASTICIRGSTNDWKPSARYRKAGKQSHIESAIKNFSKQSETKVKLSEVLLLDDDDDNIRRAKENNIYAVQVVDDESLPNLAKNLDDRVSANSNL